jgi:acyl-coenzyme A thioesterase PaaI-like protein
MIASYSFVHRGVISSAADMALTFAAGTVLGVQILTLEYKVNYLRPAQGEQVGE